MALITVDPGKNLDMKKIMGWVVVLALAGAAAYAFTVYLLPFLLAMVWGTIQLAIGVAVGAFLLYFLFNPKTWRAFKYIGEGLAQSLLGWAIEMNPFNILEYRIEQTENDSEKLKVYNKQLKGKAAEIDEKISARNKVLSLAASKQQLLQRQLTAEPNNVQASNQLEIVSTELVNAKEYIDSAQPILNDLNRLVDFTDRAYNASQVKIQKAKLQLETKRDIYQVVTTGSATLNKAWKALVGDKDLNNDAEKALTYLQQDIGQKIGDIRENIKITSQFMDGQDLDNAAKLKATLTKLEGVDLSKQDYSKTIENQGQINMPQLTGGANRYSKYLNSDNK